MKDKKRGSGMSVDYRKLRWNNIHTKDFKHILLLIFWPVFFAFFYTLEKLPIFDSFYEIYVWLDDAIPFMEGFVIPYVLWYGYMIGMFIYTLLYNIEAYKKMMLFIMIAFTLGLIIFVVFPSCQNLRPASFERDNLLTELMAHLYAADTNTNVFPSLHVVGAMSVLYAAYADVKIRKSIWMVAFILGTSLINISTVFVKQHSVLDVLGGVVISLAVMVTIEMYWEKGNEFLRNRRLMRLKRSRRKLIE